MRADRGCVFLTETRGDAREGERRGAFSIGRDQNAAGLDQGVADGVWSVLGGAFSWRTAGAAGRLSDRWVNGPSRPVELPT